MSSAAPHVCASLAHLTAVPWGRTMGRAAGGSAGTRAEAGAQIAIAKELTMPKIEPTEPGRGPVAAVIFDCDGVLVDSEPIHDAATFNELMSRGIELPPDFLHEHKGRRVVDQIGMISERYDLDQHELLEAREARFWDAVQDQVTAVPDSASCVRSLHEAGVDIAVATSGSRRWIEHVLDLLDLTECVSHVVSGDDVVNPKPHPEPYQRASDLLGVSADRCVVVEDSVLGFQSAKAAGCSVVVLVSGSETAPEERFPGVREFATSMDHVSRILRAALGGAANSMGDST